MAIWAGAPEISVGLYIWKGIIPAGIGYVYSLLVLTGVVNQWDSNIIGGAIFCGGYYWFMYILNQPPIVVDGVEYELVHDLKPNGGVFHFQTRKDLEGQDTTREVKTGS